MSRSQTTRFQRDLAAIEARHDRNRRIVGDGKVRAGTGEGGNRIALESDLDDDFLAVVVDRGPNTEPDYEDERYWVRRVDPFFTGIEYFDPVSLSVYNVRRTDRNRRADEVMLGNIPLVNRYYVTATNLAEIASDEQRLPVLERAGLATPIVYDRHGEGTHDLPTGTVVRIREVYTSPAQRRYVFNQPVITRRAVHRARVLEPVGGFVIRARILDFPADGRSLPRQEESDDLAVIVRTTRFPRETQLQDCIPIVSRGDVILVSLVSIRTDDVELDEFIDEDDFTDQQGRSRSPQWYCVYPFMKARPCP